MKRMAQLLAHAVNRLEYLPGDSLAVSSCCSIWVTNTVVSFFPLWIHVNYYFLLGLTISMSCIDTLTNYFAR
ncbi:Uncharacterised protein [Enterobacter kobei]|nr:Uncharacterised protein [Enterobacter kobei]